MPKPPHSRYAVILAGGSGQRFWPVSRDALPKQLLQLFGERTLLEMTLSRLEGVVPRNNILILTNTLQAQSVRRILPDFPESNIIAEPTKRDTGPAIALGIGWVAARDPKATMMVLPSDHLIQDEASFRKVLLTSCSAAEASEALVTIGIKPNWACPSYGYVERADRERYAGCAEDVAIYSVRRFREKPAPALAQSFLDEGTFTWNAGMFIWTVPAVRQALSQHAPVLDRFIANLQQSGDFNATFQAEFPELPKLSIDYALMEKASRVLNVEATFDWDDVGNWTSVAKYLLQTDEGNQHKGQLSQHSSRNNIVFSQTQQRVALLGVEDLIVVAVEDAILVTTKANAENIKELANELPVHLR